jgi:glycosyltransferase involved in cell wall biosynthesis
MTPPRSSGVDGPTPAPERPRLSVIIATYNAQNTIAACLESLSRQATEHMFETIVVDSSTDDTAELVSRQFPGVRLYRFSERKHCGDARNWGVRVARGKIVAFTDADCTVDSHWVENVVKAHEAPDLAIGGAIANADPESYVGWAAYFCEFSRWMPGARPAWLGDMAGANVSYKRDIFDRYGRFLEGTYCSDTEFHWRISQDGHRLRFVPSILVAHRCIGDIKPFLRHEYEHGRSFGRVRVRGRHFSRGRRVAYVLGAPLLPWKILGGIALNNLRNRVYVRHFVASLPLLAVGVLCWSAGEVVAYAGG